MGHVVYDHREEASGVPALLALEGIEVTKETLVVGDYLISERICIERKSAPDFVSSLKDGRLQRQAEEMVATYDRPVFLLEGSPDFAQAALFGAISSLIRRGIAFLNVKNEEETVEILLRLALQEARGSKPRKPQVKRKQREKDEITEDMLAAIPGVSIARAAAILRHFKNLQALSSASTKEIMAVEGVGKKTAEEISKQFSATYGENPFGD